MALTTSTIQEGRRNNSSLNSYLGSLTSSCSDALSLLGQNQDYNVFISSTKIGGELNEKITSLINIIQGQVASSVESIIDRTNSFLNRQEELNNQSVGAGGVSVSVNNNSYSNNPGSNGYNGTVSFPSSQSSYDGYSGNTPPTGSGGY